MKMTLAEALSLLSYFLHDLPVEIIDAAPQVTLATIEEVIRRVDAVLNISANKIERIKVMRGAIAELAPAPDIQAQANLAYCKAAIENWHQWCRIARDRETLPILRAGFFS